MATYSGPGPVDADAEPARGLVARARGDGDAARRAAGDLRRLEHGRQPRRVDLERVAAPRRSSAAARRRAAACREASATSIARSPVSLQPHVVLGQHHVRDPRVVLRLVLAQPQRASGAVKPVSARLPVSCDEPVEADALLDLRALRAGALVVPEDRRADRAVGGIERDQPVHLAREADAGDAVGEPFERLLSRLPPVVGILLRPARLAAWRAGTAPRGARGPRRLRATAMTFTAEVPTSMPMATRDKF